MPSRPERRYGLDDLHFVTGSCYRRKPLLASERARDVFLRIFEQVRRKYRFEVVGYVAMPEHFHMLIGEPYRGDPSKVLQVLKQRTSLRLLAPRSRRKQNQLGLWKEESKCEGKKGDSLRACRSENPLDERFECSEASEWESKSVGGLMPV